MKLHLPLGLRKALLAAFVSTIAWSSSSAFSEVVDPLDPITETITTGSVMDVNEQKTIGLLPPTISVLDVYGTLNVGSDGEIILQGGKINIYDGGEWNMEGKLTTSSMSVGNIVLMNGGIFRIANSVSSGFELKDNGPLDWRGGVLAASTTIKSNTSYTLNAGVDRTLAGTLTNGGSFTLNLGTGGKLTIEELTSVANVGGQKGSIALNSGLLTNNKDVVLGYISTSSGTKNGEGNVTVRNGSHWKTLGGITLNIGQIAVDGGTWDSIQEKGQNVATALILLNSGTVTVSNNGVWNTSGMVSVQKNNGKIELTSGGTWNQSGLSSLGAGSITIGNGAVLNTNYTFTLSLLDESSAPEVSINNGGTWNVSQSGSLTVAGGKITVNTGGVLNVVSAIRFSSPAAAGCLVLNGGTLNVSSYTLKDNDYLNWQSGTLRTDANSLPGVDPGAATIGKGSSLTLSGSGARIFSGALVDNGTLSISGGSLETTKGTFDIGKGENGIVNITSGSLKTNSAVTVGKVSGTKGDVVISGGSWNVKTGSVAVNNGKIAVSSNGSWLLEGGSVAMAGETGAIEVSGGNWNVAGGNVALSKGTVTVSGGDWNVSNGTMEISASAALAVSTGSWNISGGTTTMGGGSVAVSGGSWNISNGTVNLTGGTTTMTGGSWNLTGGIVKLGGGEIEISGGVMNVDGSTLDTSAATIGDIVLKAGGTYKSGAYALKNGATILAWQAGTLQTAATVDAAGYSLAGTGDRILDGTLGVSGTLVLGFTADEETPTDFGSLQVKGKTTVNAGGSISLASGTLATDGSILLQSTGKMEISGGTWNMKGGIDASSVAKSIVLKSEGVLAADSFALKDGMALDWQGGTLKTAATVSGLQTYTMSSAGTRTLDGSLVVTSEDGLKLTGSTLVVKGALNAKAAGAVKISGGVLDMTNGSFASGTVQGGVILNDGGSYKTDSFDLGTNTVLNWQGGTLEADATISNAIYTVTGTGNYVLDGDLSITNGGSLILNSAGANLYVSGSLDLSGTTSNVTVSNGALTLDSITALGVRGGILLKDNGTLKIENFDLVYSDALNWTGGTLEANSVLGAGNTYVLESGRQLKGTLAISGNLTVSSASDLNNLTAITLNEGGTMAIGSYALANSGKLNWVGGTLKTAATIASSATYTMTGAGNRTIDGNLTIADGGSLLLQKTTDTAGQDVAFGSLKVKGMLSLAKAGAVTISSGTLDLSSGSLGANTPDGSIILQAGGTFKIGSFVLADGGVLNWQGGTLETAATIADGKTFTMTSGKNLKGTLAIGTGAQLLLDGTVGLDGITSLSGAGSMKKKGSGTMTLSGTNSYSGGTEIAEGTLSVGSSQALGSGIVKLTGGTLDLTSNVVLANNLDMGDNEDNTVSLNGNALSFNGNHGLTGSGDLTVSNQSPTLGSIILGHDMGYTGNILLTGGNIKLDLTADNVLGMTGSLIVKGTGNILGMNARNQSKELVVDFNASVSLLGNGSAWKGLVNNSGTIIIEAGANPVYLGGSSFYGTGTSELGNLEIKKGQLVIGTSASDVVTANAKSITSSETGTKLKLQNATLNVTKDVHVKGGALSSSTLNAENIAIGSLDNTSGTSVLEAADTLSVGGGTHSALSLKAATLNITAGTMLLNGSSSIVATTATNIAGSLTLDAVTGNLLGNLTLTNGILNIKNGATATGGSFTFTGTSELHMDGGASKLETTLTLDNVADLNNLAWSTLKNGAITLKNNSHLVFTSGSINLSPESTGKITWDASSEIISTAGDLVFDAIKDDLTASSPVRGIANAGQNKLILQNGAQVYPTGVKAKEMQLNGAGVVLLVDLKGKGIDVANITDKTDLSGGARLELRNTAGGGTGAPATLGAVTASNSILNLTGFVQTDILHTRGISLSSGSAAQVKNWTLKTQNAIDTILLSSNSTLSLTNATIQDYGKMTVSASTLESSNGKITLKSGGIILKDASTVTLTSTTVSGGVTTTKDSRVDTVNLVNATLDNVTISNGDILNVSSSTVTGTATFNNAIVNILAGTNNYFGTLVSNDSTINVTEGAKYTVGAMGINSGSSTTIDGELTGNVALAGGTAILNNGGEIGGNVSIQGGNLTVNGGSIGGDLSFNADPINKSVINLNANLALEDGKKLIVDGAGTVNMGSNFLTVDGLDGSSNLVLDGNSGSSLTINGTGNHTGNVELKGASGLNLNAENALGTAGTLQVKGSNKVTLANSADQDKNIALSSGGNLELAIDGSSGSAVITGDVTTATNNGTITKTGTGALSLVGNHAIYGLNVNGGMLNLQAISDKLIVRNGGITVKANAGLGIAGGTSLESNSLKSEGSLELGSDIEGADMAITNDVTLADTTIHDGSSLTAGGQVTFTTGDSTIDGSLKGQDITLNTGADVTGTGGSIESVRELNVSAGSSLTMEGESTVTIGSNLNVKGDADISGTLAVTDKTEVLGSGSLNLETQDSSSKLGNVTLAGNGTLTVDGNDGNTVNANFVTMNGSSDASFSDTNLVLDDGKGKITLNGQSSLELTNTTVDGSIITTNTATDNSTSLGFNDVNITGNLDVVGGDLVLSGENTVGGNMTISDHVNVSFKDGASGTLEVVKGTTISPDGQLTVDANSSFKSNVTMTGGEMTIVGNGKSGINSNFNGTITFNKDTNQFKADPKLTVEGTLHQNAQVTVNTNTDIVVKDKGSLILNSGLSSGKVGGDTLTINRDGETGSVVVSSSNKDFSDDIDLGGGSLVIGANEAIGTAGRLTITGDEATLQNTADKAVVSKEIVVENDNELTIRTDKDLTLSGMLDAHAATIVKTGEGTLTLSNTTVGKDADKSIEILTQKGGSILMSGKGYNVNNLELAAGSDSFTSQGGNTIHNVTAGRGTSVKLAGDTLGGTAADPSGVVSLDGASLEAKGTSINLSEMLVSASDSKVGATAVLTNVTGQISEMTIENGSSLTFSNSTFELGNLSSAGKLTVKDATALTVRDTLTIRDGGSLDIEKGSTIDGVLALAGGSLNLKEDLKTDQSLTVNGNNTLFVAKNVSMTIDGTLTGTGSVEKTGEGTLILNREGQAFAGTLAMKEGSLQARTSNSYGSVSTLRISGSDVSVTYGVKGGSQVVFDSGLSVDEGMNFTVNTLADTVWNGKLIGSNGMLTKTGNAGLTINNTSSNQFGTTIKVGEGFLILNGKIGSDIVLSRGTMLSGTGTTSGRLTASSDDTVIEIGEAGKVSFGTMGVGSIKLESSTADTQGVYKTGTRTIIDIDASSVASDRIEASGTVDMNNSLLEIRKGVFTAEQEAMIADGTRYHIVKAGEVAGSFNEIVQHDFNQHNAHTEITGSGIDLVLSLNYKGIQKSANENAICGAVNDLDAAVTGDLFDIQNALMLTKSGDDARTALDTIGGLRLTSMMSSLMAGNTNHMRTLRDAMGSGAYRGFLAATGKTSGTDVWASPTAGYNRVDSDGNAPEFTRQSWGGMVGVDRAMGDLISPENGALVAGLALGFDHASTDVMDARDDTDTYTIDLYGSYQKGSWMHRASIGIGIHDFDMDRQVIVGDRYNKTGTSSTNGISGNVAYELSYAFKINDSSVIMPLFTVETSVASIDGYSETGSLGNAGLKVESQDAWSTVLGLGGRYVKTFGLFSKAPRSSFEVTALVTGDVGDQGAPVKASFLGAPGRSYQLDPASTSRIGFLIGAGINVPVSNSVSVFGGGSFEVRSETNNVSGNVGVRYSF